MVTQPGAQGVEGEPLDLLSAAGKEAIHGAKPEGRHSVDP